MAEMARNEKQQQVMPLNKTLRRSSFPQLTAGDLVSAGSDAIKH